MNSINFDNAYLLLIAIPLVILFTVPFLIAVRKENRNGHNVTSQILHVLMAIIIAFAAAGTSMTAVLTKTEVYVVADVSYSANKNLDKLDGYIKQLKLPRNSQVGLVCFGKDYQLVSGLGALRDLASVRKAEVDDSETNIAEALNYAGTLFSDDVIKRVVLITDGRQTDQTDTNAVKRAIDSLETLDVKVDAIFLDDNIDSDTTEVQISSAEYTSSAYKSDKVGKEKVNVTVQSTYATRAIVGLYRKNGDIWEELYKQYPNLSVGNNIITFNLDTSEPGTFDYRITVEADGDKNQYNNTYSFTQTVANEMNMLIVSGNWDSMISLITRYQFVASIDAYENVDNKMDYEKQRTKSVYDAGFAVDKDGNRIDANGNPVGSGTPVKTDVNLNLSQAGRGQTVLPTDILKLCTYDVFIIDEVDLSQKIASTSSERWVDHIAFLNGISTAVNDFGKTLITIGDLNIYGAERIDDGSGNTSSELDVLDDLLPIKYGKDTAAPDLYTIVLDVSTSLRQGQRFELARDIATRILDTLPEDDSFSLVTFNGLVSVVQMPVSVKGGRDATKRAISNLTLETGTVIGSGLRTAYEFIDMQRNYGEKKIMLISDGVSTESEREMTALIDSMYADGITTSMAFLGVQEDLETGSPLDRPQISYERWKDIIKNHGGGEATDFSGSVNAGSVDLDMFGSMIGDNFDYTITTDSKVQVASQNDAVLENISKTSIPDISGFVVGYAKPTATKVLNVVYRSKSGREKTGALYAYRNSGNGKVASFSASADGDWIQNWDTALRDRFFENVFTTSTPEERTSYPYTFNVRQEEGSTSVQVTPALKADATRTSASIKVTMPDGEVINSDVAFDGYDYIFDFISTEVGRYDIEFTYTYNDSAYVANSTINVSYASEYNDFATFDPSSLFKAVNGRGKVSTDGTLSVENDENEMGTYTVDFTVPLLILCVVLYIVDIVIRKLKWEDVVSFFGGMKKKKDNKPEGGKQ